MNKEFDQSEKELATLLKGVKQSVSLTSEEKAKLKFKLMESVTNINNLRYINRGYNFKVKGVTMPIMPIALAILLAGGAATTVLADEAKPGDLLYPVDQAIESIQEKMPMSQYHRAEFWGKRSEERAQELLELNKVDFSQLSEEEVAEIREKHQEMAANRLAESIERVEAIKSKLQEQIEAANDEAERAKLQDIITKIEETEANRTQRMEQIENGEFPCATCPEGAPLMLREKMELWKETNPEIMDQIHEEVQNRFGVRNRAELREMVGNNVQTKSQVGADDASIVN